ncbi:hypothetical protein JCGZ_05972 [Jatropha curcas]|uniref:Protein PHYTOCHROME KINASE SUBSTRATE 4 n=1 Tax=Jatropha curcas TaxID=180498 RepID=A0A067KR89_JATCU|nr:protein PHYTOCHROME KINASE SUBSTRATE 4 [Jatropha curcas]KDP37533.1 hypothetical protein JCGZ_05972 [Jatropha curcas]
MERSTLATKTIAADGLDVGDPSPPFVSFQQKSISSTVRTSDASFSSHLKHQQQQLNSQAEDSELSIFDAQKYFNENSNSGDSRMSKRVSPVNVINLERISQTCDFTSLPRFSSASSSVDGYGRNYRTRSFHATPTASSEASWNSQTGLLSNPPGAIAVSIRNPASGHNDEKKKRFASKWLLGRRCPCSGKKSVQVEEKLSEPRTPSRLNHKFKEDRNLKRQITPDSVEKCCAVTDHWLQRQEVIPISHTIISADNNRFPSGISHHRVLASSTRPFTDGTNGFSFPILNQTTLSSLSPMKLALNGLPSPTSYNNPPPPTPLPLEDPPRDSLEVFQPSDDPVSTKTGAAELQRRQSFTFQASPKSRVAITDDDIASDASSDLFEIESFSTQTTSYPMYNHRRDSMDEASIFNARRSGGSNSGYCRQSLDALIAPTECYYEPSEASIDWSVTTAEGFDKASVTNFSEAEETTIMRRHESEKSSGSGGCGKRRGGEGNGGLLSCRCEKAVSVGPQPVKCAATEGQRGGNYTLKHVSSRPAKANKPPLARSHSARLSLPFAT